MIPWSVKVLSSSDETRDVAIRDKQGVPTQMTKKMRFITIQALWHDPNTKSERMVVLKTIDPPSSFTMPKNGSEFVSPAMRGYKETDGVPIINF